MKNILYCTTRQWNPGDEFILFGIRNIIEKIYKKTNPVIYNRNPDIRPMNGYTTALRNIKLPGNFTDNKKLLEQDAYLRIGFHDNSIKFDSELSYADLAIFAGTPEWISPRCVNFFDHILKNHLPTMIIGVGHLEDIDETIKDILKNTLIATVRDKKLLEHPIAKEYDFIYLPCPALLSAGLDTHKYIYSVKQIGLCFGLTYQDTVIYGTINEETFQYTINLYQHLIKSIKGVKFSIICHYIDEISIAYQTFGQNADILYSYDAKDYINIYSNFDFIISTRVHGCGISSSLGIPNINISHDQRAGTCDGFLSDRINNKTTFEDVSAKIFLASNDIENQNKNLIHHKINVFNSYIKLIENIKITRPAYTAHVSYAKLLHINSINSFDNIIFDPKWVVTRDRGKTYVKQCLHTINSLAVRVLPKTLKERLKATSLGTRFRNYLQR